MAPLISSAEVTPDGLEVRFASLITGRSDMFSWLWLLDHSQDSSRWNTATSQRKADAPPCSPAEPTSIQTGTSAEIIEGGSAVEVSWSDGSPRGRWPAAMLAEVVGLVEDQVTRELWATPPDPVWFEYDQVISSDTALQSWLDHVVRYGFGVVRGMPPSKEAAEVLARGVGYPRETIFGGMWTLSSEIKAHSDTAYGDGFLGPHTDSTYLEDAPGMLLFCCIEREGEGGQSLLVDGFAAAEGLRRDCPEAFETLTSVPVKARYLEPGVHLEAQRPTLRLDPRDGEVKQVSYNNYDRAPMRFPGGMEEETRFYQSYAEFHRRVSDRSRWWTYHLGVGEALYFDNHRMLHGRLAYTGKRVFVGCYQNKEDFESKRRVLAGSLGGCK